MAQSPFVIDVTDQTFEREVVARSKQVPVVVDFWAPWCGPCKTLGPLLEQLAAQHAGKFVLAKVNVDENPMVARAANVQSIPLVLALRDGQIVNEFVGAQPAGVVQKFIAGLLQDEGDSAVEEAEGLVASDPSAAERLFRAVLEKKRGHPRASLGLARVLAAGGRLDEALSVLEAALPAPGSPEASEIASTLAALRMQASGAGAEGDEASLRERVAADPRDLQARLDLGKLLAARQRWEEALTELLEVVRRDRKFADEAARKAMLDVFAVLGRENPVVGKYQRELSSALFS